MIKAKKRLAWWMTVCLSIWIAGCSASEAPQKETEIFDYDAALANYTPCVTGETLDAEPLDTHYAGLVGISSEMIVKVLSSENILAYFSFDTKEWMPFCSKSGCNHDSQLCNAYLGEGSYGGCMQEGTDIYYFASENNYKNLYLMKYNIENQQYSQVCEIVFEEDIFNIDVPRCYYEGEHIYFVENLAVGEIATAEELNCLYWVCLNWKTGEMELVQKLPDDITGEYGYYDGNLLIMISEYVDDNVLTEEEYYEQYGEQSDYFFYAADLETTSTFQVLDLETGERSDLVSFSDQNGVDYITGWSVYGAYFLLAEQNQVSVYSILTGEKKALFTGNGDYVYPESIIDGCIFYIEAAGDEMTHCIYDLSTGKGYELGPHNMEGNPYFGMNGYYVQEGIQYIAKEDYLSGNWDRWVSLVE